MKLWNQIIANICCRNIDSCKLHLLEAVGDLEIAYWNSEINKWTEKMNDIVIHE